MVRYITSGTVALMLSVWLVGCGGSSDSVEQTVSHTQTPPSGQTMKQYAGAVDLGDTMQLHFNTQTKRLEYNITGEVAGEEGQSQDVSLTNIFGNFYKDNDNRGYFLSGSLALANIRLGGHDAYGVAILEPDDTVDVNDVVGDYNQVILFNQRRPNICKAHFDSNGSGSVGQCLGNPIDVTFQWSVQNGIVEIKNESIGLYLKGFYKKADKGRDIIVLDLVQTPAGTGGGVVVALKANSNITAEEIGQSTFYSFDASNPSVSVGYEVPFGKVDINGTQFRYIELTASGEEGDYGEGEFILNPEVNGTRYLGLVRIKEKEDNGSYTMTDEYAIIDSENGYYISLAMNEKDEDGGINEFYYSIGSNKPLQ